MDRSVIDQLEADAAAYDARPALVEADEFVTRLFSQWPQNDCAWTVEQKVVALDNLYCTRLADWWGWFDVARHILSLASLNPSLDDQLQDGGLEAIDWLRRIPRGDGTVRNTYVFATKYAHWHNGDAYPIYDSRANLALMDLAQRTSEFRAQVHGRNKETMFLDYGKFKPVHDTCHRVWVPAWSGKRLDKALYIRGGLLAEERRKAK